MLQQADLILQLDGTVYLRTATARLPDRNCVVAPWSSWTNPMPEERPAALNALTPLVWLSITDSTLQVHEDRVQRWSGESLHVPAAPSLVQPHHWCSTLMHLYILLISVPPSHVSFLLPKTYLSVLRHGVAGVSFSSFLST